MKRRLINIFTGILLMCLILSLTACKSNMQKYGMFISEIRDGLYAGADTEMKLTAITGIKEEPFIFDGHASGTRDFTVITLQPAEYIAESKYVYTAKINGTEYSGEMLPHPFGKTWSCDINAKSSETEITVRINDGAKSRDFNLKSQKTEDMISAEKALDITVDKLKKQLDGIKSGGTLNAEIYIRFMENPIDATGGYYWYVAVISDTQIIYAALIDSVSMAVIAIRN